MSTPANFNGAKPIIDPANAVMLLIDNAYMTGQTVALSGGMAFN